jgi:hypothetical protein
LAAPSIVQHIISTTLIIDFAASYASMGQGVGGRLAKQHVLFALFAVEYPQYCQGKTAKEKVQYMQTNHRKEFTEFKKKLEAVTTSRNFLLEVYKLVSIEAIL